MAEEKKVNEEKKDNFFKRSGRSIGKFFRDTKAEMKKVVWTPKDEVRKSTALVVVLVVVVAAAIAVVDTVCSLGINALAENVPWW